MEQLIYLAPVPWKSFAQRPHKFVEWFHAKTQKNVLWVDHYPTRFPVLSDLRRLFALPTRENDQSPPWLQVLHVPALPIEPLPGSGWLNSMLWNSVFKEIALFIEKGKTRLVFGQPSVLALKLLEKYPTLVSLYDAMDDFPAFYSGFSRLAMAWRQKKLSKKVTEMMVSSTALKNFWTQMGIQVKWVPNGLDITVLPPCKISSPTVQENGAGGNKILGYVGTMGPWFDWKWIVALAKARSQDTIRLIGPLVMPAPYALPKNIEIFPACTHEKALEAMQLFDVGLIPFQQNRLTASVDPIKYYEYRALGLPVIATAFGEMVFRAHEMGTFLSNGPEDIKHCVQRALKYEPNPSAVDQFRVYNSWEARFAEANIL